LEGVKVSRVGNRFSVYPEAMLQYLAAYTGKVDVVIDAINTIPFLTPLYVPKMRCAALVFQITREIVFSELPRIPASVFYIFEPILYKLYQSVPVLVLSESVKRDLTNFGFLTEKIFVVEPGVDHEPFQTSQKTANPSIIFMNRLARYKNVSHLVKAFSIVKDTIPNSKLSIAGCRGGKYEQQIRNLVDSLGLSHDVKFYGFVKNRLKRELLGNAWIHVLPSIREGWGISVTEAAACGTPTVAYDVVGIRDSVRDGETGFLVPFGRIDLLANRIIQVLSNDSLRESLSENALSRAKTHTWNATAKNALNAIATSIGV